MRKILSIHWNVSLGGIGVFAATMERAALHYPLRIKSLCFLAQGRTVNAGSLAALDAVVIPVTSAFDPKWISQAREVVAREAPDCILSHGFNGHFVSLLAMPKGIVIPRIATYHGEYNPRTLAHGMVAPIYNRFTNYFLRRKASSVLSVSHEGAEVLVAAGVARDKITIIHNGVPDIPVAPSARLDIRRSWGVGDQELVIGTASRLDPEKGLRYMVEAVAALLRDGVKVRLVVIGEGSQRAALEQRAAALGLGGSVLFQGMRKDVVDCLTAIDIFALPSLYEAHSIALIEAMRAGVAIVATDVGGNTESVRDGQEALVVRPADADALAHAVARLVGDEALRRSLGQAARARFLAEFTDERTVERVGRWLLGAGGR